MSTEELSSLLTEIVEGPNTPKSYRRFLESFLETTVLVLERSQEVDLTNGTEYPSPFFDILGVRSDEHISIPVFLTQQAIDEWFSGNLKVKTLSGKQLVDRTPDDWWLSLNPGSEFGKEFSSWEIEQLKHGAIGIDEILEDYRDFSAPTPLGFRSLTEQEARNLTEKLYRELHLLTPVRAVYAGMQRHEDHEQLVFGVEVQNTREEEIREDLRHLIHRHLIGEDSFDLYFGSSRETDLQLSLFRFSDPIFHRQSPTKFSYTNISRLFAYITDFLRGIKRDS